MRKRKSCKSANRAKEQIVQKRKNQKINKFRIIWKKAILCKKGIEKNIREQENFEGNEKIFITVVKYYIRK